MTVIVRTIDNEATRLLWDGDKIVAIGDAPFVERMRSRQPHLTVRPLADGFREAAWTVGVVTKTSTELTVHGVFDDHTAATAYAASIDGEIRLIRVFDGAPASTAVLEGEYRHNPRLPAR